MGRGLRLCYKNSKCARNKQLNLEKNGTKAGSSAQERLMTEDDSEAGHQPREETSNHNDNNQPENCGVCTRARARREQLINQNLDIVLPEVVEEQTIETEHEIPVEPESSSVDQRILEEVVEHYLGKFDEICVYCGALNFKEEKPTDGKFTACCMKGKVILNPYFEYPSIMQNLLTAKHEFAENFMENIRSYNSALSFASLGAQIKAPPGNGPYCFRIHGQIYHRAGTLHPNEGDSRKYAQLYILDAKEATDERMKVNDGCIKELMFILTQLISNVNPYAHAYKMLHEVEQEAIRNGSDSSKVEMVLKQDRECDPRRYNNPRVNEVAIIFENVDGAPPLERDLQIYLRPNTDNAPHNGIRRISVLDINLEPMVYPLLFPYGDGGWGLDIFRDGGEGSRVTQRQYYCFRLAVRKEFNPLLNAGKLTQQFIVDAYIKTEANRLNFIKTKQQELRVDLYKGLMDHINSRSNIEGQAPGKLVILPSSFTGSPRNMQQNYKDAMSIVQKFGKPDLFITMTCNPKWKEITENLERWHKVEHRPDLVARVFRVKLKALLDDLCKKEIFGRVVAKIYVIEFQKRGLPHAHILIILEESAKPNSAEIIDKIVCAEIPNIETHPRLYEIVKSNMVHGPCGKNSKCPCMVDGICSKGFPKPFQNETLGNVDGYPKYKRRDQYTFHLGGKVVGNQWIVPYNPYLSTKYNCHINVEVCSSVKSVKYLFKYVYKGHDCANIKITESNPSYNEVEKFVDSRYVSAPEACWRLFAFKLHDQSHSITRLAVHLINEQAVYFSSGEEEAALERAAHKDSTLTAWFKLNESDSNARALHYHEIPNSYVFRDNQWHVRKRGGEKIIGRMYGVSPLDSERYFLRLILLHVKGALSFNHLKTVNSVTYSTFREAANALGLLESDDVWKQTLTEAALVQCPRMLRQIFAFILVLNQPADPKCLWVQFLDQMKEDICFKFGHSTDECNNVNCELYALQDISQTLAVHGKKCVDFGLVDPPSGLEDINAVIAPNVNECSAAALVESLNEEQLYAYQTIMESIESRDGRSRCFFLDGPGGSGKTYIYGTLIEVLKVKKEIVLPTASTGIAANLLQRGRTVHSQYKISIPVNETSVSRILLNSLDAKEIKNAALLIVDEATMISNHLLNCIDNLCREIMKCNIPFGGKTILLGGDFRQCLPVIPHGLRPAIIQSTIKFSINWSHFNILTLRNNVRSVDTEYSSWLLKLGNGTLANDCGLGEGIIEIPEPLLSNNLVKDIFGGKLIASDVTQFARKAILCPKNNDVDRLNEEVLSLLEGHEKTYLSYDKVECDDKEEEDNFPIEFVNSLTPSGLPPHKLNLKVGAIVILLRNLNTKRGLCNGTRLIVNGLMENVIEATVLTGSAEGDRVLIPRTTLSPAESDIPFKLTRRQFPVKLAFAMSINKSQGQTFDKVGIFLRECVFAHGQLYVAFSRVRRFNDVKVQILSTNNQGKLLKKSSKVFTKNIAYPEVFD